MMRKRLALVYLSCGLILSVSCGKDQIGEIQPGEQIPTSADYLFDDTQLPRLSVSVSEEEWNLAQEKRSKKIIAGKR